MAPAHCPASLPQLSAWPFCPGSLPWLTAPTSPGSLPVISSPAFRPSSLPRLSALAHRPDSPPGLLAWAHCPASPPRLSARLTARDLLPSFSPQLTTPALFLGSPPPLLWHLCPVPVHCRSARRSGRPSPTSATTRSRSSAPCSRLCQCLTPCCREQHRRRCGTGLMEGLGSEWGGSAWGSLGGLVAVPMHGFHRGWDGLGWGLRFAACFGAQSVILV